MKKGLVFKILLILLLILSILFFYSKLNKKNQIVDQKRIKEILRNIRKKSLINKIDPKITNRIWKNMILAYIDYEKRNFKKK